MIRSPKSLRLASLALGSAIAGFLLAACGLTGASQNAPTLTGQDIGQAERATRAVFDRLPTKTGTGFDAWVVLNDLGTNGSPATQDALLARVARGLRIDEWSVHPVLAQLVDQGLVSRTPSINPEIALTASGATRFRQRAQMTAKVV